MASGVRPALITLLTDFGRQDACVGIMKGVILNLNPDVRLVDLSHEVAPQDILAGAWLLKSAWDYFPPGTIHLSVVDPGVGTRRRALAASCDGRLIADPVCDASLWGLFAFGLYSPDDPRLVATMQGLREKLWVNAEFGGLARYENDGYYRVDAKTTGNPWIICTLWLAQYLIQKGGSEAELQEAIQIVRLVAGRALPSGVLPEQYSPHTGEPVSVTPLTWSHATLLTTLHTLMRRLAETQACPHCGTGPFTHLRRQDWIETLYAATCTSIHGACKL